SVYAAQFSRRPLLVAINAFNDAASDRGGGWQPQLPLELAFLESLEALYPSAQEAAVASTPPPAATPAPRPVRAPQPAGLPLAEPPVEEAPPEPLAAPVISLGDVQARWADVTTLSRQRDFGVEALLKTGRLFAIDG